MVRIEVGNRERVNLYLDRAYLDAMKKLASLRNTTYSELIRTAVRDFIVREAPKAMQEINAIKEVGAP